MYYILTGAVAFIFFVLFDYFTLNNQGKLKKNIRNTGSGGAYLFCHHGNGCI